MRELQANGTTVVVVSHNLQVMEALCTRGVLLEQGSKLFDGTMTDAVGRYHERLTGAVPAAADRTAASNRVLGVELERADGTPTAAIDSGEVLVVRVHVARDPSCADPTLELTLSDQRDGIYRIRRRWSSLVPPTAERAEVDVTFRLPLTTGTYSVGAVLRDDDEVVDEQATVPPVFFRVLCHRPVNGVADLHAEVLT
jgi:hypothetical protein